MSNLQTCAPEPFVGTLQSEIPYGTTITRLVRIDHGAYREWKMYVCRRPIVPLWGVIFNMAAGIGGYEFAPSTKGHEDVMMNIARGALQASINFSLETPGVLGALYADGNYGGYLNRKISGDNCLLERFVEVYMKTSTFFRLHAAIGALDIALYKELGDWQARLMKEVDKQMMIPPGQYNFTNIGGIGAAANSLDAWYVADAAWAANTKIYSLELITT